MEAAMNVRNAAPPNSIRTAIIDDHPIFREGTAVALAGAAGIEVVGQGATAADAEAIARERTPDVMLLDLQLPGGGVNAAANIACACPKVRIIALTDSEDEEDVALALKAGVRGYLFKGSTGDEVIETVRAIFRGDCSVAPTLAPRLLIRKGAGIKAVVSDRQHDLSPCEETNIMQKLKVRNRVEAALKFRRANTAA
jgi:two-component system, NarL family, nitrate/nitrite response regulator NarL